MLKKEEAEQKAREANMEFLLELKRLGVDTNLELRRMEIESQTNLAQTVHDNATAQHVAAMPPQPPAPPLPNQGVPNG